MGINTFQLINLLNSSKHTSRESSSNRSVNDEESSIPSVDTNLQTNSSELTYHRMRLQFTLDDTSPETYMEDVTSHLNRMLEIINLNTPGVCLAPWHKNKGIPKEELLAELGDDSLEAVKYLYGFKAGLTKSKTQYLRIHIAFPNYYQAEDIVKKNKSSIMIPGKQTLLIANSQCINPVTIGWLLRSTPMMADFDDLSRVLKACWSVKGEFGLYRATVRDGKPYDATQTTRAMYIEVEDDEAAGISKWAEKTYGRASSNILDYPLGINLMFVLPYNNVQGAAKSMVAKLAAYQQTNDKMVTSATWHGEMALDRSIHAERFVSLRQWLMSLKSRHPKTNSKGTPFQDHLFTGIHRSPDGQEVTFYFYKANEVEATSVIAGLPLVIRDELQLDPGCFFHRLDYLPILEGTWNSATREYKNRGVMNQEQYLQELDEFFSVNRSFLPEMIVLETAIDSQTQAKAIALASGTDEVSVLSQLTEKTLRAATATAVSGRHDNDESSIESGNTSRSKTQAAVKEALKEVSLEHNKAMEEQRLKFQWELEALRRLMGTTATQDQLPGRHESPPIDNENEMDREMLSPTTENGQVALLMDMELEEPPQQAQLMDVDSSDDEAAITRSRRMDRRTAAAATTGNKSPIPKRPKRSKSRTPKGQGGPSSRPGNRNV
jgi:hypothetical protein